MKKAIFYLSALLMTLATVFGANAQKSASGVMNSMVNVLKTNSIQTNFGLIVKESGSSDLHKIGGTFLMQGAKFTFKSNEMDVYFDGKTQWAYMPAVNEVSITTPTEQELAQTNPLALIQAYNAKSTAKFIRNYSAKNAYTVELNPKDKASDIRKIQVVVSKTTYYPMSIQLVDKKGMISTLALAQFKTGVKTDANTFVFNSSIYKDIEINDLR